MTLDTFIALRYLKAKKAYRFLSFFSIVVLIGISLSVFSFTVIESVMNGFTSYMQEALIGFNAHVTVSLPATLPKDSLLAFIQSQRGVASVQLVSELDGILSNADIVADGAKIRGIAPDSQIEDLQLEIIFFGDATLADLEKKGEMPGILIGEDLFTKTKFMGGEEGLCSLIYPFGFVGPSGELEPKRLNFKILGVFSTRFYDYDSHYVLIADKEAKQLAGVTPLVEKILVRLKHADQAALIAKKIKSQFPETNPVTWGEQNTRLFSALTLEGRGMFLLLSIVTFIACFNILGLVTLLAINKLREMAVLQALGATAKEIGQIFLKVGLILGLGGMIIGLAFGAMAVFLLARYPLPLPPAYYLEVLPVKPDFLVIGLFSLMAPAFGWLAAFWPARRMSKLNAVDILRGT